MTGKEKCSVLKQIRRQIADANDIRFPMEECSHKGSCSGTCPRCEWEVRALEKALEKRRLAGKKVVLAGISAGLLLTACAPLEEPANGVQTLEGDVAYTETLSPESDGGETTGPMEETAPSLSRQAETETALLLEGEAASAETGLLEGEPALPETEEELLIAGMIPMAPAGEEDPVYELEGDVAFLPPETTAETTGEETP